MSTLKVDRLQTVDETFSILVKDIGTGGGGGGTPTGPAGGVLSGSYPDPGFAVPMATYADLQNKTFALDKILQSGATIGQAPVWNGTAWVPQNVGGGGGAPSGPAGGVLSGTYPNPGFAQPMATASDLQALADAVATATWPLSAIEQSGATSGQVPYWDGVQWVPQDAAGGIPGPANVLQIGTVTSGPTAEATITGGSPNQTLNLVLPKGDKGDGGAAATVAVGTVTTGAAGSAAAVTNSGTTSAAVLNFTIPQGAPGTQGNPGLAATVAVGTVTTGAAGSAAAVTNSGNANAAVFNFTIPQGAKGDKGDTGSIPDSGITPGTYTKATYNSKGQAVSGTNPAALAGYGITDAVQQNATTHTNMAVLPLTSGVYRLNEPSNRAGLPIDVAFSQELFVRAVGTDTFMQMIGSWEAATARIIYRTGVVTDGVNGTTPAAGTLWKTIATLDDIAGVKWLSPVTVSSSATMDTNAPNTLYKIANAQTLTIPANATVAIPIGTAVAINVSSGTATISAASGVLLYYNGAYRASVTVSAFHMQSLIKTNTNTWVISGTGIA